MVISRTSIVAVSIQAVSPESSFAGEVAWAKALQGTSVAAHTAASLRARLERIGVDLLRADPDGLLEVDHEDLAVADLARACRGADRLDRALELFVGHGDFDLELGQEVDNVLGAPIELGVPVLPAEALHLGHRHALHPRLGEGLPNVVQRERLDDRVDPLHYRCSPWLD